MSKVLCILPNASSEINGVAFVPHAAGMLSEDISDEQAALFTSIPGYEVVGAGTKQEDTTKDAERADLLAQAEAIGFKVKGNWSLERLRTEVETAAKAAAAAE